MSIEKFSGTFSSEANGVTVLVNSVIQSIKDIGVLGLYTYLASKPDTWEPNAKEIMRHFEFSKDKVYRLINALIKEGLMSMKEIRDKGKFAHYSYTIHLHRQPRPENQETVEKSFNNSKKSNNNDTECTCSPCPEKPDAENKDTYKEKRVKNKEKEVRKKTALAAAPPQFASLDFHKIRYPKKPTEKTIDIFNRGMEVLNERETTLEEYLTYLEEYCLKWLRAPYGDKQRTNDELYLIMKPSIIIDALEGKFEDKKHVTRN
jgi:hypothetical protein